MILINMTGLDRFYWLPVVAGNRCGPIWYLEVKFLRVQVCLYSRVMGAEVIRRMKRALEVEIAQAKD